MKEDIIKCVTCRRFLEKNMFYRNDVFYKTCNSCSLIKKKWARLNKDHLKVKIKEYQEINKDRISEKNRKRYLDNRDEILSNKRDKYSKNKEKFLLENKKYQENNKEKIKLIQRIYNENNKEKLAEERRNRERYRRLNDPQFKIRHVVSHSISLHLKKLKSSKNKESVLDYLQYTIEELKIHLESLFEPWMNWSNHGKYDLKTWNDNDQSTWTWQIDHIIPHSSFKYKTMHDKEFIDCWALLNLRPLSAKENMLKRNKHLTFIEKYIIESQMILKKINKQDIFNLINYLVQLKNRDGRLFILGVGGSAGTATHAVNDFRKICNIESYAPTDNVPELTARSNDEGFETVFAEWLKGSKLKDKDAILILSVGGGNLEKNVSVNLIRAIDYANDVGAKVLGIVGRDGGYTKTKTDCCVIVPTVSDDRITAHTEGLASVLLHLIVSHPSLKVVQTKWESVK